MEDLRKHHNDRDSSKDDDDKIGFSFGAKEENMEQYQSTPVYDDKQKVMVNEMANNRVRKTVTWLVQSQNDSVDEEKRKVSLKQYFVKEEDPNRIRGLTKIKNILIDFENDSDFLLSSRPREEELNEEEVEHDQEGINAPVRHPTIKGGIKSGTSQNPRPISAASLKPPSDINFQDVVQ